MTPERQLQASILRALGSRPDVRLFRNQVGQGWAGKYFRDQSGRIIITDAYRVTYGLTPGSGDLIGWQSVVITPEMVGQRIAQFLSVEVKTEKGRISDDQKNWLEQVNLNGGKAMIVKSAEEAEAKL